MGGRAFLEWYQDPDPDEGARSHDLQHADYTGYVVGLAKEIGLLAELGWAARTCPNVRGDDSFTHEWYVLLGLDDRVIFKTEEPVINPYVAYYMDMDDLPGSRIETGISHWFRLSRFGFNKTPILRNVTLTPSFWMTVDHRYITEATRLSSLGYGLAATYDVTQGLKLPPKMGQVDLSLFIEYQDSLIDGGLRSCVDEVSEDRLYGGVTLGFSW